MRLAAALITTMFAVSVFAKLPPPTDDARVKAAQATAKTAWTGKVGLYQLCLAMDRKSSRTGRAAKRRGAGRRHRPRLEREPCEGECV